MEQITSVGSDSIKISVPQPTIDTFYTMTELIIRRDAAQTEVDKFNNLISQAQALGVK